MPKRRYSYYSTQFQDPGKDFFSLLFIVFFMLAILMTSFYQSLTKKIESPQTSSKSGNKEIPNVSPPKNKIIYLKNINNKLLFRIDIQNIWRTPSCISIYTILSEKFQP